MLRLKTRRERLDLNIDRDTSTGLPLNRESEKLLDLILAYLPLPFIIAEHGCGKKADIILRQLVRLGVPAYALKRGMVMEKDMSNEALQKTDFTRRPHALVAENPLYRRADITHGVLLQLLERNCVSVESSKSQIKTDGYVLHHCPEVQFIQARSHIFPVVTFWDDTANRTIEMALDPTFRQDGLIDPPQFREVLSAPEALIFTAPLLGRLWLDERFLTPRQRAEASRILQGSSLARLSSDEHADLVRKLNGAEKGSVGDPARWTYSNNILSGDSLHDERQMNLTGNGSALATPFEEMLEARRACSDEVLQYRDVLQGMIDDVGTEAVLKEDADWSEERLKPLADVANSVSYYLALRHLSRWIQQGRDLQEILLDDALDLLRGIGVRLRDRIERLAEMSEDSQGSIDARALNPPFIEAVCDTVAQMNQAGLTVFVDQAGSLHGMLLSQSDCQQLRRGRLDLKKLASRAICHCSHIDTVKDAGKYDGRLGVLSGIEMAHILSDLKSYFDVPLPRQRSRMMVSAFIGEEMTYTGEDISMPGSAAVAGHCRAEQVYRMTNDEGDSFAEGLVKMLSVLKERQAAGSIQLENDLNGEDAQGLLLACSDPQAFYTPHTFERHIEQGPLLDRWDVPLVHVDSIMGIRQQDVRIQGDQAEAAALEIVRLLRLISQSNLQRDLRVTVGIIEGDPLSRELMRTDFAQRWTLVGEKNHAGATLLEDRRDPAVAAARLVDTFFSLAAGLELAGGQAARPLVGGILLEPGLNRNVIPEQVSLTLALDGSADERDWSLIASYLHNEVVGKLSQTVGQGGEGVKFCSVEPIDYLNLHRSLRLSVDVRSASQQDIEEFCRAARLCMASVQRQFEVELTSEPLQEFYPVSLHDSGQVLQIERSYGGSHNPNEAELSNDLLRGSLLQFVVTHQFLQSDGPETSNLFEFARQRIPAQWTSEQRFISGALHDTCNIARRSLGENSREDAKALRRFA